MSEEQQQPTEEAPTGGTASSEILQELQSLGRELTATVRALWESEESRRLRQEIGEGFVELGRQVDAAVQSAQESETARQLEEQVKEAVEKARQSDLSRQVEEGLLMGLRVLNEQLSRVVSSLSTEKPPEAPPEDESEPPVSEEG